jgi:lactate oxidase
MTWPARAQVREEAENEPVTIVRKGIDKQIEVISVDLLEAEAKTRLPQDVYVFIAHGAGEQWDPARKPAGLRRCRLRPAQDGRNCPGRNRYVGHDARPQVSHPVFVSPMGSHGLVHPEAEIATAEGAAKSGGLLCVSSASTASLEDIGKASPGPKWF